MNTAIMHYSAPPVVGGVESVIHSHANQFASAGLPLTVITGRGEAGALPGNIHFLQLDLLDNMSPVNKNLAASLDIGIIPVEFNDQVKRLADQLRPVLARFENLIVHNVLTKHFNLPLTAALFQLMDEGVLPHVIAWCHDLSWSSPNSRSRVFPKYPWTLLKTPHRCVTYVAVSEQRKREIIDTFGISPDAVRVIYNGVDPGSLLGLSVESTALIEDLDLWKADLILLMPVRVTRAKNIEFAMRVASGMKEEGIDIRIVLTGPPDPHDGNSLTYYGSLLELRKNLKVENEMRFVYECGPQPGSGYRIDPAVVAVLYRMADALFMPSVREGFGMPVLEAGLLGLPVIAAKIPAVSEIAGENALIISPDDSGAAVKQILQWLQNKPEFIMRGKVRRRFTWEQICKRDLFPLLKGD